MSIAKLNNIITTNIPKINDIGTYFLTPDTKLLSKFDGVDGATAYTAETGQTVTFEGTAQIDTAQKRFGLSSLLLDGNSDYVTLPDSADWDFGTGDFTIDCWVRFNDLTGYQFICGQYVDGDNYWRCGKLTTSNILYWNHVDSATERGTFTCLWSPVVDTWYHLAFVRTSATATIYIDGAAQSTTLNTAFGTISDVGASPLYIGQIGASYVNGWLDAFRITKGTALWTSNFAPPIDISKINNIVI